MTERWPELQESQSKLTEQKQNTEGENEAIANSRMQNALESMIKNKDPKIQAWLEKSDLRKNVSKFLGEFFEWIHLEKKEDISRIESILRQQIEEMVAEEVKKAETEKAEPKKEETEKESKYEIINAINWVWDWAIDLAKWAKSVVELAWTALWTTAWMVMEDWAFSEWKLGKHVINWINTVWETTIKFWDIAVGVTSTAIEELKDWNLWVVDNLKKMWNDFSNLSTEEKFKYGTEAASIFLGWAWVLKAWKAIEITQDASKIARFADSAISGIADTTVKNVVWLNWWEWKVLKSAESEIKNWNVKPKNWSVEVKDWSVKPKNKTKVSDEARKNSEITDNNVRTESAGKALWKELTEVQEKAIIDAHEVWLKRGWTIWEYTPEEITEKWLILKKAWFKAKEIRQLMEDWYCWSPAQKLDNIPNTTPNLLSPKDLWEVKNIDGLCKFLKTKFPKLEGLDNEQILAQLTPANVERINIPELWKTLNKVKLNNTHDIDWLEKLVREVYCDKIPKDFNLKWMLEWEMNTAKIAEFERTIPWFWKQHDIIKTNSNTKVNLEVQAPKIDYSQKYPEELTKYNPDTIHANQEILDSKISDLNRKLEWIDNPAKKAEMQGEIDYLKNLKVELDWKHTDWKQEQIKTHEDWLNQQEIERQQLLKNNSKPNVEPPKWTDEKANNYANSAEKQREEASKIITYWDKNWPVEKPTSNGEWINALLDRKPNKTHWEILNMKNDLAEKKAQLEVINREEKWSNFDSHMDWTRDWNRKNPVNHEKVVLEDDIRKLEMDLWEASNIEKTWKYLDIKNAKDLNTNIDELAKQKWITNEQARLESVSKDLFNGEKLPKEKADAIIKAHNVWKEGEAIWEYGYHSLNEKMQILQEGWFSKKEAKELIKWWYCWAVEKKMPDITAELKQMTADIDIPWEPKFKKPETPKDALNWIFEKTDNLVATSTWKRNELLEQLKSKDITKEWLESIKLWLNEQLNIINQELSKMSRINMDVKSKNLVDSRRTNKPSFEGVENTTEYRNSFSKLQNEADRIKNELNWDNITNAKNTIEKNTKAEQLKQMIDSRKKPVDTPKIDTNQTEWYNLVANAFKWWKESVENFITTTKQNIEKLEPKTANEILVTLAKWNWSEFQTFVKWCPEIIWKLNPKDKENLISSLRWDQKDFLVKFKI